MKHYSVTYDTLACYRLRRVYKRTPAVTCEITEKKPKSGNREFRRQSLRKINT